MQVVYIVTAFSATLNRRTILKVFAARDEAEDYVLGTQQSRSVEDLSMFSVQAWEVT